MSFGCKLKKAVIFFAGIRECVYENCITPTSYRHITSAARSRMYASTAPTSHYFSCQYCRQPSFDGYSCRYTNQSVHKVRISVGENRNGPQTAIIISVEATKIDVNQQK